MGNMLWGCPTWRSPLPALPDETSALKTVDAHDRAVLELKVQRDRLEEYKIKAQYIINKENDIAKQLLKQGKKRQALLTLKKRKYQETLLEKTETQLQNINDMVDSIEFSKLQLKVFDGLKLGNKVLKDIHAEMNLEAVEQLMDDTRDAIAYQNEIDSRLSEALSAEDQAEVEAELEQLEKEQLPSAPDTALPAATSPAATTTTQSVAPVREKKPVQTAEKKPVAAS